MMTTTRTRTRTAADATTTNSAITKTALYTLAGVSSLAGLWAAACFVGALMNVGPVSLMSSWFSAVAGM